MEMMPAPDNIKRFLPEIGRAGLSQTDGHVTEEKDPDLRGLSGVKVWDEMRLTDPAVATGLRAITWILERVPWRVVPGGQSEEDEKASDLVSSAMDDMSYPWAKVVRDALTCLPFGWAYCEVVYKLRQGRIPPDPKAPQSSHDDGMIGWRKIVLISQTTLDKWKFDETGGILGMYQTQPSSNGLTKSVFIPIEKSVLFRIDDERNNPEGMSLLRPVYNAWWVKKQLQEIEAIGIERDLTGVLIIYMPTQATDDDYAKAKNLLEQYKVDDMTGFVAPQFGPNQHEQWRFEIINSPGNKQINVGEVINRYSADIARMFLVQFLMLGIGSNGSWALSRDQRDMFQLALESVLDTFADTMNRYLIPPLMQLNGFDTLETYPKVRHGRIAKSDMQKFALAVSTLQKEKLINYQQRDEEFVREELDLPSLPEDFEWTPIEDRNIQNIVEMQSAVGQAADEEGRIQTPEGRPTPNQSPEENPQATQKPGSQRPGNKRTVGRPMPSRKANKE